MYPEFSVHFKNSIIGHLQTDSLHKICLTLLPSVIEQELKCQLSEELCSKYCQNFFVDLHGRHAFDTPCKDDSDIQVALQLINIFSPYLKLDQLSLLVNWTCAAEHSSDEKLRGDYAAAVSQIYRKATNREQHKAWLKMFVRLYNDKSPVVQNIVQEFWSETLLHWKNSPQLILELMELIGDLEDSSISILVSLVMARCSASPDFSKTVFEHPLDECKFVDFQLDTSWRMRNSNFHRLFAETYSSDKSLSSVLPTFLHPSSQRQVNMIRATMKQLQFSPTAPNQMSSQSSMVGFGSAGYSQMLSLNSPIDMGSYDDSSESSTIKDPLARLRRKFYASPDHVYYAGREIEKQETEAAANVEEIRSMRGNVKLARSYRIGELPDIVMKHNDILFTISALAKRDDNIGRVFLIMVFNGIVKELGNTNSAREFLENARQTFETVFRDNGDIMSIQMGAAILEICIAHKIRIDPKLVSIVTRQCGLQKLSILLLEEYVALGECVDSLGVGSTKRLKTGTAKDYEKESETDMWLRITEMYKDFEEYDVIRGIFNSLSESSEGPAQDVYLNAKVASTHESVGQLEQSLRMYDALLLKEKNGVASNESGIRKQLWEDAISKVTT